MEENRLDDEDQEGDDGLVLSEDDILQVIELGDDEPMNGLMEEVDDSDNEIDDYYGINDDGDDQNAADDSDLIGHSNTDQANVKDDAVGCFTSHTGSVFSIRLSPDGTLAVTGGEDDKAFVWKTMDCSILFVCSGHKDSVTCTGFSHDGKYVTTADMSGLVQVWKVTSGECIWTYECSVDLEWLLWHPSSSVLLAGTSDGLGWMWKVPTNDCKCFQGPGVRNICGVLLPDGRRACYGYENGHIAIWDLKTATVTYEVKAHSLALTCISAHQDNNLLLTGSEDSTAQLVSSHSKKVLCKFEPEAVGDQNTIETVGFCQIMPLAATGSLNGTLAIWDIPSQKLRHTCTHPEGVVKMHWCHSAPLLYTACLDGVVRLWDARNASTVRTWEGHTNHLLDMDITRDNSTIVTACEDGTARIFSHQF